MQFKRGIVQLDACDYGQYALFTKVPEDTFNEKDRIHLNVSLKPA